VSHTQPLLAPSVATLVVGAKGLLGREILAAHPEDALALAADWTSRDTVVTSMERGIAEFFGSGRTLRGWSIVWAAGRCVVSSTVKDVADESDYFQIFLDAIRRHGMAFANGQVSFISSAGGVYGGSSTPQPFSETADLVSISPYGSAKIHQEHQLEALGAELGFSRALFRPGNLYGVRQDVNKAQGLISHLILSAATQAPINVYVPLDSRRHYIVARDAARKISMSLESQRLARSPSLVKNIYGGPATSVASLISLVEAVSGRPIRLTRSRNNQSHRQPIDVLLASNVLVEIDAVQCVSLEQGVREMIEHIVNTTQDASVPATN